MIVLDTNVVSALMRRDPDPTVITWHFEGIDLSLVDPWSAS